MNQIIPEFGKWRPETTSMEMEVAKNDVVITPTKNETKSTDTAEQGTDATGQGTDVNGSPHETEASGGCPRGSKTKDSLKDESAEAGNLKATFAEKEVPATTLKPVEDEALPTKSSILKRFGAKKNGGSSNNADHSPMKSITFDKSVRKCATTDSEVESSGATRSASLKGGGTTSVDFGSINAAMSASKKLAMQKLKEARQKETRRKLKEGEIRSRKQMKAGQGKDWKESRSRRRMKARQEELTMSDALIKSLRLTQTTPFQYFLFALFAVIILIGIQLGCVHLYLTHQIRTDRNRIEKVGQEDVKIFLESYTIHGVAVAPATGRDFYQEWSQIFLMMIRNITWFIPTTTAVLFYFSIPLRFLDNKDIFVKMFVKPALGLTSAAIIGYVIVYLATGQLLYCELLLHYMLLIPTFIYVIWYRKIFWESVRFHWTRQGMFFVLWTFFVASWAFSEYDNSGQKFYVGPAIFLALFIMFLNQFFETQKNVLSKAKKISKRDVHGIYTIGCLIYLPYCAMYITIASVTLNTMMEPFSMLPAGSLRVLGIYTFGIFAQILLTRYLLKVMGNRVSKSEATSVDSESSGIIDGEAVEEDIVLVDDVQIMDSKKFKTGFVEAGRNSMYSDAGAIGKSNSVQGGRNSTHSFGARNSTHSHADGRSSQGLAGVRDSVKFAVSGLFQRAGTVASQSQPAEQSIGSVSIGGASIGGSSQMKSSNLSNVSMVAASSTLEGSNPGGSMDLESGGIMTDLTKSIEFDVSRDFSQAGISRDLGKSGLTSVETEGFGNSIETEGFGDSMVSRQYGGSIDGSQEFGTLGGSIDTLDTEDGSIPHPGHSKPFKNLRGKNNIRNQSRHSTLSTGFEESFVMPKRGSTGFGVLRKSLNLFGVTGNQDHEFVDGCAPNSVPFNTASINNSISRMPSFGRTSTLRDKDGNLKQISFLQYQAYYIKRWFRLKIFQTSSARDPSYAFLMIVPFQMYTTMIAAEQIFRMRIDEPNFWITILTTTIMEFYRDTYLWWHLAQFFGMKYKESRRARLVMWNFQSGCVEVISGVILVLLLLVEWIYISDTFLGKILFGEMDELGREGRVDVSHVNTMGSIGDDGPMSVEEIISLLQRRRPALLLYKKDADVTDLSLEPLLQGARNLNENLGSREAIIQAVGKSRKMRILTDGEILFHIIGLILFISLEELQRRIAEHITKIMAIKSGKEAMASLFNQAADMTTAAAGGLLNQAANVGNAAVGVTTAAATGVGNFVSAVVGDTGEDSQNEGSYDADGNWVTTGPMGLARRADAIIGGGGKNLSRRVFTFGGSNRNFGNMNRDLGKDGENGNRDNGIDGNRRNSPQRLSRRIFSFGESKRNVNAGSLGNNIGTIGKLGNSIGTIGEETKTNRNNRNSGSSRGRNSGSSSGSLRSFSRLFGGTKRNQNESGGSNRNSEGSIPNQESSVPNVSPIGPSNTRANPPNLLESDTSPVVPGLLSKVTEHTEAAMSISPTEIGTVTSISLPATGMSPTTTEATEVTLMSPSQLMSPNDIPQMRAPPGMKPALLSVAKAEKKLGMSHPTNLSNVTPMSRAFERTSYPLGSSDPGGNLAFGRQFSVDSAEEEGREHLVEEDEDDREEDDEDDRDDRKEKIRSIESERTTKLRQLGLSKHFSIESDLGEQTKKKNSDEARKAATRSRFEMNFKIEIQGDEDEAKNERKDNEKGNHKSKSDLDKEVSAFDDELVEASAFDKELEEHLKRSRTSTAGKRSSSTAEIVKKISSLNRLGKYFSVDEADEELTLEMMRKSLSLNSIEQTGDKETAEKNLTAFKKENTSQKLFNEHLNRIPYFLAFAIINLVLQTVSFRSPSAYEVVEVIF